MRYQCKNICYLCGLPVSGQKSDDHVVPKQLIKRSQPKVKGFDYAGKLPSHDSCNTRFRPEISCQKALRLISVLQDDNYFTIRTHQDNPDIKILAIDSDCLSAFSQQDLQFFKFIDVCNKELSKWSNPSFFTGKPKTNPLEHALFVSLSVLAKSASALLVSRELKYHLSNQKHSVSSFNPHVLLT